jgi:hypothetical protein
VKTETDWLVTRNWPQSNRRATKYWRWSDRACAVAAAVTRLLPSPAAEPATTMDYRVAIVAISRRITAPGALTFERPVSGGMEEMRAASAAASASLGAVLKT